MNINYQQREDERLSWPEFQPIVNYILQHHRVSSDAELLRQSLGHRRSVANDDGLVRSVVVADLDHPPRRRDALSTDVTDISRSSVRCRVGVTASSRSSTRSQRLASTAAILRGLATLCDVAVAVAVAVEGLRLTSASSSRGCLERDQIVYQRRIRQRRGTGRGRGRTAAVDDVIGRVQSQV